MDKTQQVLDLYGQIEKKLLGGFDEQDSFKKADIQMLLLATVTMVIDSTISENKK